MTVAELIEKLREMPQDMTATVLDGEHGYTFEVESVKVAKRNYLKHEQGPDDVVVLDC